MCYTSKLHAEELVRSAQGTGSVGSHVTFGERDPCDSFYRKVKSSFLPSKPRVGLHANIGVAMRRPLESELAALPTMTPGIPDVLTVTTDNNAVKHIDAVTLQPLEVTTQDLLHPDLGGPLSAAHAREDPVTGDVFNYNLTLGPTPVYR